jgi:hypothetical protein
VFLTGADVPDDAEPVRAVATMASGTVWHVFELLVPAASWVPTHLRLQLLP